MKKNALLLTAIIFLAVFFRFNNLNWDQGFHLHPDERFLTMVGNAMKLNGVKNYLNPAQSTLNPANIGFKFYVYGTFPLVFNKIVAVIFGNDNYNSFTIQGRFLSAIFDIFTLIIIFKLVKLLEKKYKINSSIKYWAAFLYAIAVLPIQLSHFFAVDTFLTFFMFASFYFIIKFYFNFRKPDLLIGGFFLSLALACKVSAIYIMPLLAILIFFTLISNRNKNIAYKIINLFIYGLVVYLTLRLATPYYFETANILDPTPNKLFMTNIRSLESFNDKNGFYPPGIQWISKNNFFSSINLAFFGLGLPYFFILILGIIFIIFKIIKTSKKKVNENLLFGMILVWVSFFFIYQSTQFVKAMRYFIFLYPFFAVFAAIGIDWFFSLVKIEFNPKRAISYWPLVISLILLLIWPLSFSSIYLTKNSRVQASEWIYKNIPQDKLLLNEHWDDPLPLLMENNYGKNFKGEMLPIFYPDNEQKWQEMNLLLAKGDYYILSSNRGWGSIPTVPDKYPLMSKFYEDLFAGKLQYQKVKEFVSFPKFQISNFKFQIDDSWADESFTVYDHPKVMIFKNEKK